jgi:hypothetical protein
LIMAILWLVFMSLFLAALVIPLAQRFGYSGGHAGKLGDILSGFARFLLEVIAFSAFMALAGYLVAGTAAAVTLGLVGLAVGFLVVSILSTVSALSEWRTQERLS